MWDGDRVVGTALFAVSDTDGALLAHLHVPPWWYDALKAGGARVVHEPRHVRDPRHPIVSQSLERVDEAMVRMLDAFARKDAIDVSVGHLESVAGAAVEVPWWPWWLGVGKEPRSPRRGSLRG